MKTLILISLFISGSALACSCEHDYGRYSATFMNRAAVLIGEISGKDIQVNDYKVESTVMTYVDPTAYSRRSCGCTQFVKRIWNISYNKGLKACEAKIVLPVWNDKMKITDIACK